MGELREVYSEHYDAEWDVVVWELTQSEGTLGYKLGLYRRDTAESVSIGAWDMTYNSVKESLANVSLIIADLKRG